MSDRQVFIGNLCDISTEILRTYCEKYGSLAELSFNRDKENNVYHCFAFVTFQYTRHTSKFMSKRPHYINGQEIFVKRALPRSTSTIPERLIVTNRLILQDFHKHNKQHLRTYFQKFGQIKKFDIEHGSIDYEDYDDVDRILLARPHYINDKEISVTKFHPLEHKDNSDNYRIRSNHRNNNRYSNNSEQPDRIITASVDTINISCSKNPREKSSDNNSAHQQTDGDEEEDDEEDSDDDDDKEMDCNILNTRYEYLEEEFEKYKQSKEIEICSLRMDLERLKRQLTDKTQEKLDLLLKNQQLFHNELILRLCPDNASIQTQTAEEFFQSESNFPKKRKLTSTSTDREYDYYS